MMQYDEEIYELLNMQESLLREQEEDDVAVADPEADAEEKPEAKPKPKPQEAKPEKTQDDAEVALDPTLEKEFFHSSFEVGDTKVTMKTLGLGPTAPIVVYVNDKRWEIFPGPKKAEKATKEYIQRMTKESYFTHSIHSALSEGKAKVEIGDGKVMVIEKADAKAIMELYDRLSFNNQSLLVDRFFIDSNNMASVIDFAHKNRK